MWPRDGHLRHLWSCRLLRALLFPLFNPLNNLYYVVDADTILSLQLKKLTSDIKVIQVSQNQNVLV